MRTWARGTGINRHSETSVGGFELVLGLVLGKRRATAFVANGVSTSRSQWRRANHPRGYYGFVHGTSRDRTGERPACYAEG